MVVGQPASLLLHTQDRFGNSRAAGGEDVDVELSGPAGKSPESSGPRMLHVVALAKGPSMPNGVINLQGRVEVKCFCFSFRQHT